jgi:hypothetical protein
MARTLSGSGALSQTSKTVWHRLRQSSGRWDCRERPVARQWYHWELNTMAFGKPVRILIMEDNARQARLARRELGIALDAHEYQAGTTLQTKFRLWRIFLLALGTLHTRAPLSSALL